MISLRILIFSDVHARIFSCFPKIGSDCFGIGGALSFIRFLVGQGVLNSFANSCGMPAQERVGWRCLIRCSYVYFFYLLIPIA